jgi:hypothetical protein
VYVGSEDHKLYAFKNKPGLAKSGPAISSWPMFGKNSRRLPGLIEEVNETAPHIVFQPQSQTRPLGQRVALIAEIHGQGPFQYQWFKDGTPITGQTQPVLSIAEASNDDSGDYFVNIENPFGLTRSFPVTLTLTKPQPAQIVLNPRPLKAEYGQTIQLKVTARGTVTFEWLKEGESLDPAKDSIEILNDYSPIEGYYSILTLKTLQTDDEGLYSVIASNEFGKMESTVARLSVGPSQLFKFSSTTLEDDGYLRIEVVGPVNHDVVIQVSSDFLQWKDMLTIPLNKPLPPAADSTGQPDLGSAELRLPVLPVGENLEQKKVEIAVRLSKLAIAKWISDEQGIEVELIFILSRDDTREQQLKQGYPLNPDHPEVLKRLEKGRFFRCRLVEASAPAP